MRPRVQTPVPPKKKKKKKIVPNTSGFSLVNKFDAQEAEIRRTEVQSQTYLEKNLSQKRAGGVYFITIKNKNGNTITYIEQAF
jgi:hypothetical protein